MRESPGASRVATRSRTIGRSCATKQKFFLAVALGFGLPWHTQATPPLADTHSIFDRTHTRQFVVAQDELHINGRIERVPAQPTAELLHRRAPALAGTWRDPEPNLVLYPIGAPRTEANRCILTRHLAVEVKPGTDISTVAKAVGAEMVRKFPFATNTFLLKVNGAGGPLLAAEELRAVPGVRSVQPQLARRTAKKLVPNDPFFSQQWHLRNTGQNGGIAGIDVRVTNVWNSLRGAGVVIGIVDDGLQLTHPDLALNVNTELDWDFNDDDDDPSPDVDFDWHGTAVSGLAGGRGANAMGVTGVAYEATLVGLRLLGGLDTDAMDAAAMSHSNAIIQIKNNSWGAFDCNFNDAKLEGAGPLMRAAVRDGVQNGRGGKGVIYTFAGGNGRNCGDDINYDGYANLVEVFTIGAVSDQGQQASYSEPGACLVAVAPSSSAGRQEIVTTDLAGDDGYNFTTAFGDLSNPSYTKTFTGTSASTPIASGVIALVLDANRDLSYRDVKEILLRSSRKVQPSDADWKTNSAGIVHNHRFGAGLLDADAAVRMAANWPYLGRPANLTQLQTNLSVAIPDNDPAGVTRTFAFTNTGFRVESVTLTLTAPHPQWGDLAVTLTSPGGTQSRLAEVHGANSSTPYEAWTFSSVRHWGEQAAGEWTVTVADRRFGSTGILEAMELTFLGSEPNAILTLLPTNSMVNVLLSAAAPGWRYVLESAHDFDHTGTNWSEVGVLTVPVNGQAWTSDTNSMAQDRRFYRARLLP